MAEVVDGMAFPATGLDTAATPRAARRRLTRRQVPTGTVDLTATTDPGRSTPASPSTQDSTAEVSALPSARVGVGTHTTRHRGSRQRGVVSGESQRRVVEPGAQQIVELRLVDHGDTA